MGVAAGGLVWDRWEAETVFPALVCQGSPCVSSHMCCAHRSCPCRNWHTHTARLSLHHEVALPSPCSAVDLLCSSRCDSHSRPLEALYRLNDFPSPVLSEFVRAPMSDSRASSFRESSALQGANTACLQPPTCQGTHRPLLG